MRRGVEFGLSEQLNSAQASEIKAFPKPQNLTLEHLNLENKGPEAESAYLYALIESWYGIKKDEVFKVLPKGFVWGEQRMLKMALLLLEGWNSAKIAKAFKEESPGEKGSRSGHLRQLQHKHFTEAIIGTELELHKNWTSEEAEALAKTLCTEYSYTNLEKDAKKRKRLSSRVWYKGKSILEEQKTNPQWEPWLPKLTPVAAFIVQYGNKDFEEAITVARRVSERSTVVWTTENLELLAKKLVAGRTKGEIAFEWKIESPDIFTSTVRREGLRALESATGKDWTLWKEKLTPTSAFLVKYGNIPFREAVNRANEIAKRGGWGDDD